MATDMSDRRYLSSSAQQTRAYGRALATCLQADDVVLLDGTLGAGKTQFAKGVAAGLGVRDEVTSPTFTILMEYDGTDLRLLHFDLYRLEHADDLDDIDFHGLLESGGASLVEWASKFSDAMPSESFEVRFELCDEGRRALHVAGRGARGRHLAAAFGKAVADMPCT